MQYIQVVYSNQVNGNGNGANDLKNASDAVLADLIRGREGRDCSLNILKQLTKLQK